MRCTMKPTSAQSAPLVSVSATYCIGCVSFLNARPLIDGVAQWPNARVRYDVPSRLLEDLECGAVDIAMCPVIDFYRSRVPLAVVPVGGIASDGETFTVRLYSRVPIEQIEVIHADTDSHTSVNLMRVLMAEVHGRHPQMVPYSPRDHAAHTMDGDAPQAMLLIGDKVVTSAPDPAAYCHQWDLGAAWRQLTGLPFMFAVWMARRDANLGELPVLLQRQGGANKLRLESIADRYASLHGWPLEVARRYLGSIMKYEVGPRELEAMQQFGAAVHRLGLIDELRPLTMWNRR